MTQDNSVFHTLEKYNIRWNSPSSNAGESMPCGGGDVGLNVWVENGDLLIYIARSGIFDELNAMPKLGRLRVRLSPNPFETPDQFRQELKLREGFVQIVAHKGERRVNIDVWVDVHRPVAHVDVSSSHEVSATITYENWRLSERPFGGAEVHAARSWAGAPQKGTERPDVVCFVDDGVQSVHHNQGFNAFDLIVTQQELDGVKSKMFNPIADLAYGVFVSGDRLKPDATADGQYASTPFRGWRLTSVAPSTSHHVQIVMHTAKASCVDDWRKGLLETKQSADANLDARQRTLAWWEAFWQRSHIFVDVANDKSSSPAWQIGRNYQVFRYQLGCNAYGTYPTKFNGGLFTVDPQFVDDKKTFSPDFRQWGGGSFTAQNQRLIYWPMLKSGDFDLMKSQFEFYRRSLVNAELRSRVYFNIAGACFTEQIENSGLPVGYEYGWKRKNDVRPGIEDNAWVSHQWDTVFEFCQMILDVHFYSGAKIDEYLPLIESCLSFYEQFYPKRDGKMDIFIGTACETYKNARNPSSTIAALRGVLESLLKYQPSAQWQAMLDSIPDLAFREKDGHKTIAPAWEWSHKQNCELPQLYPVYPWRMYGVGRADLQVAIDTWKYGADAPDQKQIISWHQDPIFCARLGLTEEAAKLTTEKLKDAPRRFPTFWGPGHDWVPDHNWGGSGMIALQEMLLQIVEDKIYVLPAWPMEWNVSFKLHAPGKTVVECELIGGKIARLNVTLEHRRKDVVLPAWVKGTSAP